MVNVVFVAPYFGANILQCMQAFCALDDVRLGIVTHEAEERVPTALRPRIAGHYRVQNSLDPDQLINAGRAFQKEWGTVDRILGYMEQMQLPLAHAREALGIPGMDVQTATNFRDKNRMKEVLGSAGLPVARQARVTKVEDARRFVEAVGYPVILKPLAGLGTKDTFRVSSDDEMFVALNQLLPSRRNAIQAEEFVSGAEHTFETACVNGEPVWFSSTYYLPGPLQVVENPWMQYCVLLPRERVDERSKAFHALNTRALKSLGLGTGLSHMEYFLTSGGKRVISEVAARPPGVNIMTMNSIAHEVDFWKKWAQLMVHDTFDMPERKWACGCAFFRGQGRGRVIASVEGLDETLKELGDTVVEARLPKVGHPRSTHYEGEGWAIVRHAETAGAVEALRKLISNTRLRYT
ncbi:ATP-grasp domain-containing protein [Planctomycetota bacterium]|nr:ATP-grasp domain-containing protein [Planctomycetota bacterium]